MNTQMTDKEFDTLEFHKGMKVRYTLYNGKILKEDIVAVNFHKRFVIVSEDYIVRLSKIISITKR